MIKRISMLFQTPFRKRMENDWEFRESLAVQRALQFPGEVLGVLATHFKLPDKVSYHSKGTSKHLRCGHAENNWLEAALQQSHRLQIVFQLASIDVIQIRFEFFRRGNKQYVHMLEAEVDQDGTIRTPRSGGLAVGL